MNSLSWFIYFAGVVNGLTALLLGFGVFGLIGAFIALLVCDAESMPYPLKKRHFAGLALSLLLAALIPSQNTLYAIAASEMGEELLKTPLVGKAGKALENWLDDQLEEKESN